MLSATPAIEARSPVVGGFLLSGSASAGCVSVWSQCDRCPAHSDPRRVRAVDAWRDSASLRRALIQHHKSAHPSTRPSRSRSAQ